MEIIIIIISAFMELGGLLLPPHLPVNGQV